MTQKVVMNITPAQASEWLKLNKINRPLNNSRVKQYTQEMKAGKWECTHQGIAFTEDGDVADGQHRLYAIVRSGVTVTMEVTFGLPRKAVVAIDRGLNRSVSDALTMSIEGAEWINRKVTAATKWAFNFPNGGATANQIYDNASKIKESLLFAISMLPGGRAGLSKGPVLAAIALMHAGGEDEMKLRRFCNKLASGVVDGTKESAVVRLREYLMNIVLTGSSATAEDIMKRTQRAFEMFRDGAGCKRLHAPETLIYPRRSVTQ